MTASTEWKLSIIEKFSAGTPQFELLFFLSQL
jgi:hypothetical protein